MFRKVVMTDTQYQNYLKKFAEDKTISDKMTLAKYIMRDGWRWSKKESAFMR